MKVSRALPPDPEIEMLAPDGPKLWHTKPGNSKLDANNDEVRAHNKFRTMQMKSGFEVEEKVVRLRVLIGGW